MIEFQTSAISSRDFLTSSSSKTPSRGSASASSNGVINER